MFLTLRSYLLDVLSQTHLRGLWFFIRGNWSQGLWTYRTNTLPLNCILLDADLLCCIYCVSVSGPFVCTIKLQCGDKVTRGGQKMILWGRCSSALMCVSGIGLRLLGLCGKHATSPCEMFWSILYWAHFLFDLRLPGHCFQPSGLPPCTPQLRSFCEAPRRVSSTPLFSKYYRIHEKWLFRTKYRKNAAFSVEWQHKSKNISKFVWEWTIIYITVPRGNNFQVSNKYTCQ